jgi:hypothetical protein
MRRATLAHQFDGRRASPGAVARGLGGLGALARLRDDKRGGAALVTLLGATSLLGVAGLTVEVGNRFLLRRNMQAAADGAAIAGAWNFDDKKSATGVEAAARSVASRNGFVHGEGGYFVDVSGPDAAGRVTVAVERRDLKAGLLHAAGFSGTTRTIVARGVAQVVDAGPPPCILAMKGSLTFGNKPSVTAADCALASNSSASNAIDIGSGNSTGNGPGTLNVGHLVTHGGCDGCSEAQGSSKLILPAGRTPSTYAPTSRNAYAELDRWDPTPTGCKKMPSAMPLSPGCYTGMEAKNNAPVDLKPGIYYIQGGNLTVGGDLTCSTCTPTAGVSIVLVGSGGGAPGVVDAKSSQACIYLNASVQTSEARLNGVVIWRHNPNGVPNNSDIDLSGGANMRLDGALVAPTSGMTMGGNSAAGGSSTGSGKKSCIPAASNPPKPVCNMFVVGSMEMKGNTSLSVSGCSSYGTSPNAARIARLVE